MAHLAILREAGLDVTRIGGAVEVFEVTAPASCAQTVEVATAMAGRAREGGVHPYQREAREFEVIERRPLPTVHVVALLAGHGEIGRLVIRQAGLLEIRRMAGNALDGKPLELPCGGILVAIITDQGRVRADQGEAVLVPPDALQDDLPAAYRVAPCAVPSELPLMDIRVAVRALRADVGEHQTYVTLRAGHAGMQATQGKSRFVVIKLDDIPQGLPGRKSMTVLTGYFQVAVWTSSCGRLDLALPLRGR